MSFGNCNCAEFLDLLVFLFVPLLTLLALEKELYNSDVWQNFIGQIFKFAHFGIVKMPK